MDENIGRVVAKLRELGKLDNTLLMFLSDNGCCAEGGMFGYQWNKNTEANFAQWRKQSGRSSSAGEAWSNASNTPFRMHKRWVHEGGIATPLVVHWPNVISEGGQLSHQVGHVADLLATCIDAAQASYPDQYGPHAIKSSPGISLLPSLREPSRSIERVLFWEHETHSAIRVGDWKLVTLNGVDESAWELYDMSSVRTETDDVADENPKQVAEMKKKWMDWAAQADVLPWPSDRVAEE